MAHLLLARPNPLGLPIKIAYFNGNFLLGEIGRNALSPLIGGHSLFISLVAAGKRL